MVILKKKQEVNYRRGTTGRHCAVCDHYEPRHMVTTSLGEAQLSRCVVIGLQSSPQYRVGAKNLCDRFDNSKRLAAIMGAHNDRGE